MPEQRSKIALALDLDTREEAEGLLLRLSPKPAVIKIGMQLVYSLGLREALSLISSLSPESQIFLDLKLHDIPNTVARAIQSIIRLGIPQLGLLTVHTLGGLEMLKAAQEATMDRLSLAGVTLLTSHSQSDFSLTTSSKFTDYTLGLGQKAYLAGLQWLVCSAHEIGHFKQNLPTMKLITPGIRPDGSSSDDQARITTPKIALEDGSDLLVIGRPIYRADDPAKAWSELLEAL